MFISCVLILCIGSCNVLLKASPAAYRLRPIYELVILGGAILYTTTTTTITTTTTQRGWCTEVFGSLLAQLQSQKLFPGGGGV